MHLEHLSQIYSLRISLKVIFRTIITIARTANSDYESWIKSGPVNQKQSNDLNILHFRIKPSIGCKNYDGQDGTGDVSSQSGIATALPGVVEHKYLPSSSNNGCNIGC